ncbi:MAG: peptidylprolyl isomerase [Candidatus Micrarchaeota archaeon]|nr:peptidylprolyl isomerase [Candidatus Micrarchaeota archaeon]
MVKNGDFIRIEYTGYDANGNIFDSTFGEIAKSLHDKEGALLVIYGTDRLVPGMEEALTNMQIGNSKELQLTPEKAFGHKIKNMIRIMPEKDFYRSEIRPEVGLAIHMDSEQGKMVGVIKSVSGGRVLVDFNHPLADKNIKYTLKLVGIIDKTSEKINAMLADMDFKATIKLNEKEDTLEIEVTETPKEYEEKKQYLDAVLKGIFPTITTITFKDDKKKQEIKTDTK